MGLYRNGSLEITNLEITSSQPRNQRQDSFGKQCCIVGRIVPRKSHTGNLETSSLLSASQPRPLSTYVCILSVLSTCLCLHPLCALLLLPPALWARLRPRSKYSLAASVCASRVPRTHPSRGVPWLGLRCPVASMSVLSPLATPWGQKRLKMIVLVWAQPQAVQISTGTLLKKWIFCAAQLPNLAVCFSLNVEVHC